MKIELVGIHEIAIACGYTSQCVANWRRRHIDFPKPIIELAMGPVFDGREVEIYLKSRDIKYFPVIRSTLPSGGAQVGVLDS